MSNYILSDDAIEVPVGDGVAVYHRLRGGLCLLDSRAHQELKKYSAPQSVCDSLLSDEAATREEELFQQLVLRGILIECEKRETRTEDGSTDRINVIQLILTNACNFGCTYCFEGAQGVEVSSESIDRRVAKMELVRAGSPQEVRVNINDSIYASRERLQHQYDPKNRLMKPGDAIVYVEKALEVSKSTGVDSVMIQFFGGEPFLNWKSIRAVLDAFGRGERHGIHISYSTVTNGSLISDEMAETLARHEVAVCVSIDSPNGKKRPLKNGADSTSVVLEGLSKLHRFKNRIAINAALTSDTWDEFDETVVDLADRYGAREIGVVVDFDPNFYKKYGAQNIVEKLWGVVVAGRKKNVVLTGYWHQIFQILTGHDTVRYRGFKNCSAKGAQFSIEPNGSVFSCKAGSGRYGSILEGGSLLQTDTYRKHASLRHQNPPFCNGCEIEGFCAGLCLGPIEKKYGKIDAIEPAPCDVYRGINRKLIQALLPGEVATFELN